MDFVSTNLFKKCLLVAFQRQYFDGKTAIKLQKHCFKLFLYDNKSAEKAIKNGKTKLKSLCIKPAIFN